MLMEINRTQKVAPLLRRETLLRQSFDINSSFTWEKRSLGDAHDEQKKAKWVMMKRQLIYNWKRLIESWDSFDISRIPPTIKELSSVRP